MREDNPIVRIHAGNVCAPAKQQYVGTLCFLRFHFQFLSCHNVHMVSLGLETKTLAVALKKPVFVATFAA